MLTVGELFAGIGGFSLAARWAGWSTRWYSEIEPYASRVMAQHWPDAPNLGDITQITNPPPVDVLVGGFPCQDISLAGKGAGIDGERSGLWFHYARLIGEIRPSWVIAENVSALRGRGLDKVLGSLAALGYDAEWHCIPAAYVGAPHRRDRIWIIAYPAGTVDGPVMGDTNGECQHCMFDGCGCTGSEAPASAIPVDTGDSGCRAPHVADTERAGLEGYARHGCAAQRETTGRPVAPCRLRGRADAAAWWASEPDVGRVANGIPARVDRLRCLGNALVPQVALLIFQAINRHRQQAL